MDQAQCIGALVDDPPRPDPGIAMQRVSGDMKN
jgi:hypothetical protein